MQAPTSSTEAAVPRVQLRASGQLIAFIALCVLVPLLFWPSTAVLLEEWTDFQNLGGTHGFLILAISLWLLFERRERIATTPVRPSLLGFVLLAAGCLLWLVLVRASLRDPHAIILPGILMAAVLAVFGFGFTRVVFFPIAFLGFATPVGELLTLTLQAISVHAVDLMCWATGLPAYVEGTIVNIPSGRFEVEGGCSGVHFFIVGLAIAAYYGEITYASLKVRTWLIALMFVLAPVCNWVRIFVIVLAGHLTQMKHWLITVDHYWFGWGLFAVFLVFYLWVIRNWPAGKEPKALPFDASQPRVKPVALGAAALVLVVPPLTVHALESRERDEAPFLLSLPAGAGGWSGPDQLIDGDWKPDFQGAHGAAQSAYRNAQGATVEVAAFIYLSQRQSVELISDSNSVTGHHGVSVVSYGSASSHGEAFTETEIRDSSDHQWLIWSTYFIGDQPVLNGRKAQLLYGVRSLLGAPVSAALAMSAPCESDCKSARATLDEFFGAMGQPVRATLHRPTAARSSENQP